MTIRAKLLGADCLKDAHAIYQRHHEAATRESKRKNLNMLWQVLEDIREAGMRDYSIAEVGRRLERSGGPKSQSLRNAQGAHFREVITAFAGAVSGSIKYVPKTKSQVDVALDMITDPSIRAVLKMAIEEGKRLKVVNDNLHSAFKNIQIGETLRMPATPAPATSDPAGKMVTANNALTPRLLSALKKGIDSCRLAERGLSVASNGTIINEHQEVLFPPSFVTAIQAVLAHKK